MFSFLTANAKREPEHTEGVGCAKPAASGLLPYRARKPEACQTYLRGDDLALLLSVRAFDASAAMKVLLGIVAQCAATSA